MDALMQQLLEAKDEEIARLAETVLRIWRVLDDVRTIDRNTLMRLEVLEPEVLHAERTYNRLMGAGDASIDGPG